MDATHPFKLIRPDAALALRGLRVLIGGPESPAGLPAQGSDIDMRVEGFLAYANAAGVDIKRQILAVEETPAARRIAGMCLWVPSPGRTAMLFIPSQSEFPQSGAPCAAAVAMAIEDARAAGIVLTQAMLEPADAAGKTVFAAAGLVQLTTLTYMERKPPMFAPAVDIPTDIQLAPYSAATHALFREAIAESYEGTLDCPALAGMRDMEDVIAGHKAVGPFDPQLWSVVLRGKTADNPGRVAGCLLLSEIPARRGLELVYLGLAPFARGQGLGRTLMQRILAISSRRHFDVATLAVDVANIPAVKLYRRCGYSSVAQRIALIKRLH